MPDGFLAQVTNAYRKFKKMYVVDNTTNPLEATDDFIGKKKLHSILIDYLTDKIRVCKVLMDESLNVQ